MIFDPPAPLVRVPLHRQGLERVGRLALLLCPCPPAMCHWVYALSEQCPRFIPFLPRLRKRNFRVYPYG